MIIDMSFDVGQAGQGASVYYNIVENGFSDQGLIFAHNIDIQTHASVDDKIVADYFFGGFKQVLGGCFRQKTDFPELDAQHRNVEIADPTGGA